MADAEFWIDPEVWREIRNRVAQAAIDLHAAAQPPRTPGTIRTSTTIAMFQMEPAQTEPARRIRPDEPARSSLHCRSMISETSPAPAPGFRLLLAGRTVSTLGNSFAPIALAFAVLDLTGSATDLGLVVGARTLVNVLFLLFGGVLADRMPKHLLMVGASVAAAVTQGAVAALVLTDTATIPLLIALSAVNGMVGALVHAGLVRDPAADSSRPTCGSRPTA